MIRVDIMKHDDEQSMREIVKQPFPHKDMSLHHIERVEDLNYLDSLEYKEGECDMQTDKLSLKVYGIQTIRFSKLLTWLIRYCSKLKQLSLSFDIDREYNHFPLQIEGQTGLTHLTLQNWQPNMAVGEELLEKSKDTLVSLELIKCGLVSLSPLHGSLHLKSLSLCKQSHSHHFFTSNQQTLISLANLHSLEGGDLAPLLSSHIHSFPSLNTLTLTTTTDPLQWLYQPLPSLRTISVGKNIDIRRFLECNKHVKVIRAQSVSDDAVQVMREHPWVRLQPEHSGCGDDEAIIKAIEECIK
ncbi:hypothetical protein FGO68_gene11106 [Halteria grandinella]|uniref:Uncharacterized protein n=1 Tax=Halteria grandinella TaxID=5974 RepID=A0A8J8NSC3_HALGN|nr:hypothetical protein FGO68_gene11106 [Halteria grandinella]